MSEKSRKHIHSCKRPDPLKVFIEIRGGNVQEVYTSSPAVALAIVDRDNAAVGDLSATRAVAELEEAIGQGAVQPRL
jgi:hypothetical protein